MAGPYKATLVGVKNDGKARKDCIFKHLPSKDSPWASGARDIFIVSPLIWLVLLGGLHGPWRSLLRCSMLSLSQEVHDFARYYSCMFVCDSCLACNWTKHSPKHLYYADWNPGAAYMDTRIDHATYEASEMKPSPWLRVPGWSLHSCFWDQLHVVWLGFARDLAASIIVEFYLRGFVAGPEEEGYKRLTTIFRNWCRMRKIQGVRGYFSKSSLNIHANEYPELASWFKAIHVKIVVMWLAEQCQVAQEPQHKRYILQFQLLLDLEESLTLAFSQIEKVLLAETPFSRFVYKLSR